MGWNDDACIPDIKGLNPTSCFNNSFSFVLARDAQTRSLGGLQVVLLVAVGFD